MNRVVSREEWLGERIVLLEKEKAFSKQRDTLTRERQALPWVKVDKSYVFEGREGRETLADLFGGCSQLIVYHFMYHPNWGDQPCRSCSYWADNFNGIGMHLNARDVNLVAISKAALVLRHIFIFVYEVIRQMARFTPTKEDHMAAKYVLKLAEEERQYLSEIAKGRRGKQAIAQWKVTRAKALLKCDQGELGPAWGDRHIADALDVTERSIQNWRKRAVLDGPETALVRKLRSAPPVTPKVDGRVEAHLTKLACSTPPKGRNRWTLRLLAEKVVELELVDSLSHETVRRTLKKKRSETVAQVHVVHSFRTRRRLRRSHGARSGGVCAVVRRAVSCRVHG